MKKLLLGLLMLLAVQCMKAQTTFEKRIEFELKDGYTGEEVMEFGEDGMIVRSYSEKSTDGQTEWKYDRYDNKLDLVDTKSVFLDRKYYASVTYNTKSRSHTLYRDKSGNYSMVTVEAGSMEVTKVRGMLPKSLYIGDMVVLGDFAYFYGSLKKAAYLVSINWKTGDIHPIPVNIHNFKPKQLLIDHFQVIENSNEVFLYVKARIKKLTKLYVVRLDADGEKKDIFDMSGNLSRTIVNVTASSIGGDRYIFTGTYSSSHSNSSEGLFFCEAQKGEINYIKYYNYLDLKKFLSYLPEKKQERIEKKKEKTKKQGGELKLNCLIASHDVIPVADGYIFLGEAYYPTYRTETYTTVSANGTTTTTTRRVFDGYQYTHAVLAKFSKEGELMWDQSFEMWPDYKPYSVRTFISFPSKPVSSIDMVFANRNLIISKSVDFDGEGMSFSAREIPTDNQGDRTKYSFSNMDYWYDNYFVAYGIQVIKNKNEEAGKRRRKVFFIAKIKY